MYMGGVVLCIWDLIILWFWNLRPATSLLQLSTSLIFLVLFVHIILAHFLILIKLLIRVSILVAQQAPSFSAMSGKMSKKKRLAQAENSKLATESKRAKRLEVDTELDVP